MRQENFSVPEEVAALIDELIERHPEWRTRKWWLYVAAILDLVGAGEEELVSRVERVAGAAATGGIGRLVAAAKAGNSEDETLVKPRPRSEARAGGSSATPGRQNDPAGTGGKPDGRTKK